MRRKARSSLSRVCEIESALFKVSRALHALYSHDLRTWNAYCLISSAAEKPPSSTPLFLTPIDVTFFSHEFGTMFRVSHRSTVSAADIQILASIADEHVLVEDSGVVFVARELTDQLLRWTNSRRVSSSPAPSRLMRRR